MSKPTNKPELILEYIKSFTSQNGYAPTVREIAAAVGLKSPATVQAHIRNLMEKGLLVRNPDMPRTIKLKETAEGPDISGMLDIPMAGLVTAGTPILAQQNIQWHMMLPKDLLKSHDVFSLKVRGDSMTGVNIFDGDYVIVHKTPDASNGDIVVAMVDDEATVKTFYKEKGHFRLQPENPVYDPIILRDVQILGKVIGIFRLL